MRFYRLLKDTPTHNAGAIFVWQWVPGKGWYYVDYDSPEDYYDAKIVEDESEWFEEVEQIFVRTFNAEPLKEIDEIADEEGDIIQPNIKLGESFL